jgi:hypothetical protein
MNSFKITKAVRPVVSVNKQETLPHNTCVQCILEKYWLLFRQGQKKRSVKHDYTDDCTQSSHKKSFANVALCIFLNTKEEVNKIPNSYFSVSDFSWHLPKESKETLANKFLDAFAKLQIAIVIFVMSICPYAWNNSAPTGWILMKLDIKFFRISVEKIQISYTPTHLDTHTHSQMHVPTRARTQICV